MRQCSGRWGTFLDEAIRFSPSLSRGTLERAGAAVLSTGTLGAGAFADWARMIKQYTSSMASTSSGRRRAISSTRAPLYPPIATSHAWVSSGIRLPTRPPGFHRARSKLSKASSVQGHRGLSTTLCSMTSKMPWSASLFPRCSQNCLIVEQWRALVFSLSRGLSSPLAFAIASWIRTWPPYPWPEGNCLSAS